MTLSRPQDHEQGFSVLEMIIALTISSLLLAVVGAALYGGRRALDTASAEIHRDSSTYAALYLSRLMSEARSSENSKSGQRSTAVFDGSEQDVRFISAYTTEAQVPGLYEWRLTYDAVQKRLVLYQRPITSEGPAENSGTVLLDKVDRFSMKYLGARGPGGQSVWGPSWFGQIGLPEAVAVTLLQSDARVPVEFRVSVSNR